MNLDLVDIMFGAIDHDNGDGREIISDDKTNITRMRV